MIETRCRVCGRNLRVQSLPAMCPKCRTPVSLPPAALSLPSAAPTIDETDNHTDLLQKRIWMWLWISIGLGILFAVVGIDDLRLRIYLKGMVPASTVASSQPPAVATAPSPVPPPPATQPATIVTPFAPAAAPTSPATPIESAAAPPPTQPAAPAPRPFAALEAIRPYPDRPLLPGVALDAQIGSAIQHGADYLISQFAGSGLSRADSYDAELYAGLDALCVNALLHAGQVIDDARLRPDSEFMKSAIDRMKSFPMNGNRATYSRSLRISALTLFNRASDREAIENDYAWLLRSVNGGAYTYQGPRDKEHLDPGVWDNSNSQYGALGMWAASDAGLRPLGTYWEDVTQHWETCQTHSGGWAYSAGNDQASLAMTAAGVSILFAARDQTAADSRITEARPTPISRSLQLGLDWLDEADHSIQLPGDHPGYALYGLERAGLASGYKFFGNHNWYVELASQCIKDQQADGSWLGGDQDRAETAFRLLFLSRGRPPIFMNKLRYDGDWNFRPRDVTALTHFASRELERPLNWQVVGLDRSTLEWSDCPVLFICGESAPTFSDEDCGKLREFVAAGGMIFTQSERGSAEFDHFAADLARRLYPSLTYGPLPTDHPIYSSIFTPPAVPSATLSGISNGVRLLMVHAGGDLSRQWNGRYERSTPASLQLGTNIVVYATGRSDFRNRTSNQLLPDITTAPTARIPVARIRYGSQGVWDPEPGAWKRMAHLMQFETGILPSTIEVDFAHLTATTAPLAHLTGTGAYPFTDADVEAVRRYITDGGILFIDSAGGSKAFAASVRNGLATKLASIDQFETIDPNHPLLNRGAEGMLDLTKPQLRQFDYDNLVDAPFRCRLLHLGKGDLIFCDLDVTSGMLGTNTWGIRGYRSGYAEGLMNNLILWTMKSAGRIGPP